MGATPAGVAASLLIMGGRRSRALSLLFILAAENLGTGEKPSARGRSVTLHNIVYVEL